MKEIGGTENQKGIRVLGRGVEDILKIFEVEEGALDQVGEKVAYFSSVSIETCVFCDGLAQDRRQLLVRDVTIIPVYAIIIRLIIFYRLRREKNKKKYIQRDVISTADGRKEQCL